MVSIGSLFGSQEKLPTCLKKTIPGAPSCWRLHQPGWGITGLGAFKVLKATRAGVSINLEDNCSWIRRLGYIVAWYSLVLNQLYTINKSKYCRWLPCEFSEDSEDSTQNGHCYTFHWLTTRWFTPFTLRQRNLAMEDQPCLLIRVLPLLVASPSLIHIPSGKLT